MGGVAVGSGLGVAGPGVPCNVGAVGSLWRVVVSLFVARQCLVGLSVVVCLTVMC